MFQQTVNTSQALGVPGEFYDDSIKRVRTYVLDVALSGKPAIGRVFTRSASGGLALGGNGAFLGVLCSPKTHARPGLDATLTVQDGAVVELADIGPLIVTTSAAALPGDAVQYDVATGEIAGAPANPVAAGMKIIPGAKFILFEADAGGLAVVQLNFAA